MQTANVLLSLGGDHGNQVMKHDVTASEIAVLRAIHGDDAVKEIEPCKDVKRSNRDERARLLGTYGAAKSEEGKPIVEGMFPGVAARVFETLAELDLPDSFFKATGHLKATAEPVWPSAPREDGPTIAEWVVAGYSAGVYPPSGYASKSTQDEIDAAVAAEKAKAPATATEASADDEEAEDSVGDDINDEHAETNVLG